MITLENSQLIVSVLHPADDRALLGPRYCTGGYVYQVADARLGPLLSGPEYPSSVPSLINGQGMPDVFQFTLFDDPDERPASKLVIGVGVLDNAVGQKASDSHFTLTVADYCEWEIVQAPDAVSMTTHQSLAGRALGLERVLRLDDRMLTSTTRLKNLGNGEMPFRWFAHPFFPRTAKDDSCKPGFPFTLPACGGFFVDAHGAIALTESYDWNAGCFQLLEGVEGKLFSVHQRHPKVDTVTIDGDFPLHRVAIWANANTFSIEPFVQRTLRAGEEAAWTLSYRF